MITIRIFERCDGFKKKCLGLLGGLENLDKIASISIADLDQDGPDACIVVNWNVDNQHLRDKFDDWCMRHFNRYAEYHMINGMARYSAASFCFRENPHPRSA